MSKTSTHYENLIIKILSYSVLIMAGAYFSGYIVGFIKGVIEKIIPAL